MSEERKYSQYKAMMALAVASFRSTMRSPSAVIFTLLFPMVFIVVFGFIGGGNFKMTVALDPSTNKANPVYKGIEQLGSITFKENMTEADIQSELEKGNIDGYLKIENSTPNSRPHYIITLKTSKASAEKGKMLNLILNEVTDKINLSQQTKDNNIAEIRASEVSGRKYSMIDFILPGQLGFSLLSTGVFGTAFVFFSLRQTLVLKRFFATPVKRTYIVLGEGLSRLVFAMLGAIVILVMGYFVFNFTLIHGIVTAINMLVLSAFGLIVFMGFGFIISGIARNNNIIPPLANTITMPQFLLSGTFFPITLFPAWLQKISNFLPLTHLNNALRKIAFEGASLLDVGKEVLILVVWGIVIYIAAAKTFKWE